MLLQAHLSVPWIRAICKVSEVNIADIVQQFRKKMPSYQYQCSIPAVGPLAVGHIVPGTSGVGQGYGTLEQISNINIDHNPV